MTETAALGPRRDDGGSSGEVTITRGSCPAGGDGVYVNGTVDANSLTYDGASIGCRYAGYNGGGGAGVIGLPTQGQHRGYAYDSDGLVMADSDKMNIAYNRQYAHDYLGRLSQMTVPNTPGANADYYYDRWGNLYQATGPVNWNVGISGSTNRITTSGFAYDSDGRLTSDGSRATPGTPWAR